MDQVFKAASSDVTAFIKYDSLFLKENIDQSGAKEIISQIAITRVEEMKSSIYELLDKTAETLIGIDEKFQFGKKDNQITYIPAINQTQMESWNGDSFHEEKNRLPKLLFSSFKIRCYKEK